MNNKTKCLIIGSGPAGYTAAIYTGRANLEPILYEGMQPGGQLTITTEVENFPGYPNGVSGPDMMSDMRTQAAKFCNDIRYGSIVEADFSKRPFVCKDEDGNVVEAETVIIATGASAKWLGLESEQTFRGAGVSACATCDGFFFRGKDVAVVGGGDTAAEEACYLASICNKVYMIVRRDVLRASKAMQDRVFRTKNIEVLWNTKTDEVLGVDEGFMKSVTGLRLESTKDGEKREIKIDGLFLAIGHHPNSDIFKAYIETDGEGYIKVVPGSSYTNVAGVFAAGDVKDPVYRQGITAAGSGCMAAIDAERWLMMNEE